MTRTVLHQTLSALTAVALVSAFAFGPASAGDNMNIFQFIQKEMHASKTKTPEGLATQKPLAQPKGLATKKDSQQTWTKTDIVGNYMFQF